MTATRPTTIGVALIFSGFADDPEELTKLTGIKPSESWRTGDSIGRSSRKHPRNGWQVSAPKDIDDIEAAVDALFLQLHEKWDLLQTLSKTCCVELSVVIYADEQIPAIHFRDDQVRRLAELSGKIDVDVYCLGADERL